MSYNSQLANLVGTEIRINRGGPDSATGVLIGGQSDYLVLKTKDAVVYFNAAHIKSISESGGSRGSRSGITPRYIMAYNFNNLLQRLRQQFVQINRGGPEKIEGFIAESTSDYLLLVVNKEVIRIPVFHIKSIAVLGRNASRGNKSSSNQSNANASNGKQQNNKTSGNADSKSNGKSGKGR